MRKCNLVLIYSRNAFFAPINGPQYEISNNVVCASTKGLDQPAHNVQSDQSLC